MIKMPNEGSTSILDDVKQSLDGIPEDDKNFDINIMLHINAALARLNQLGIGNRLFDSVEQLSKMVSTLDPIDYSMVTPKISMFRQSSWDYLKQALSE